MRTCADAANPVTVEFSSLNKPELFGDVCLLGEAEPTDAVSVAVITAAGQRQRHPVLVLVPAHRRAGANLIPHRNARKVDFAGIDKRYTAAHRLAKWHSR